MKLRPVRGPVREGFRVWAQHILRKVCQTVCSSTTSSYDSKPFPSL
ncbi:uncharacterized protein METZ01_LOCUS436008, partial [marine metagenome]